MKTILRLLFAVALAATLASTARANLGQVTTLSTSSVKTICVPGQQAWFVVIQNLGSNAVNVTLDGGSTYTDTKGRTGTDPTTGSTGKGYVIPPATNGVPGLLIITQVPNQGYIKPIRAIMQTGTTTLNIITPDLDSTFPTS